MLIRVSEWNLQLKQTYIWLEGEMDLFRFTPGSHIYPTFILYLCQKSWLRLHASQQHRIQQWRWYEQN
jgi:hypothetical protein